MSILFVLSCRYLAQLYYKVTKIKLEMDGDPKILKGGSIRLPRKTRPKFTLWIDMGRPGSIGVGLRPRSIWVCLLSLHPSGLRLSF